MDADRYVCSHLQMEKVSQNSPMEKKGIKLYLGTIVRMTAGGMCMVVFLQCGGRRKKTHMYIPSIQILTSMAGRMGVFLLFQKQKEGIARYLYLYLPRYLSI